MSNPHMQFITTASSLLHEEQQVRTLSTFREAYFGTSMEETVFALLGNLATRKPFFDVVMTGHSFGAAMATIGAVRYALKHPMIRVSCHVFGSPRVGGEDFRQLVHSVPNLKVRTFLDFLFDFMQVSEFQSRLTKDLQMYLAMS